ncbi:MAG: MBL fold metallo-hydrolase [Phascolarctobacterium sp.]|nr:MBL fold metallo-hydrolase [Phascolarctobacterium sp.]
MKLTMLGTGDALSLKNYNTCFTLENGDDVFLVDGGGGNGLMVQLEKAGIDYHRIHNIFVTHKHTDHLLGIVWIARFIMHGMHKGAYEGEVCVFGHEELMDKLERILKEVLEPKELLFLNNGFYLVPVEDGEEEEIIGYPITFFDLASTKTKQFGFTIEYASGKRLTCLGDEPYHAVNKEYVLGSTWLLHESYCLYSQKDIFDPYAIHHSTVKDACEVAESLKIKNLLLYHTEDKNFANRKELYYNEGKEYYHGNLYIPDDLEWFLLE